VTSAWPETGFRELALNETDRGPHHVAFLATVRIALEPIRAAQAVLVRGSLEQFSEGVGLIARKV
jgi:hypothetical protein